MALIKITEGITGQQAADIIYNNDVEAQTNPQTVVSLLGEVVYGGILNTGAYSASVPEVNRTGFIPVSEGDRVVYSGAIASGSGATALNGYAGASTNTFVSVLIDGRATPYVNHEVVIPAGVNYIIASARSPSHPQYTTPLALFIHKSVMDALLEIKVQQDANTAEIGLTSATLNDLLIQSLNLIDKSQIFRGYYGASGQLLASQNTICTPLIPIDPAEGLLSLNIAPAIGSTDRLFFYDASQVFISKIAVGADLQGVAIPPTARYVSINIYSTVGGVPDPTDNPYSNALQLEYGAESTTYQPYGRLVNPDYLPTNTAAAPKIVIRGLTADSFAVDSLHDNGDYVTHEWVKLNKLPQHDIGWYANNIIHNGRLIVQGSFNWIHIIAGFTNEGQHVGHGHGCETDIVAQFYIDGVEFIPADIVGVVLEGELFSFNIASEIYAADSAETLANWNGSNVVPQLPLIVSTKHYMNGYIAENSRTYNLNKLVIMRDGTTFARCYAGMHLGFRDYFDRVQLHNIENTMNNIQALTPIAPSTASLTGNAYDTAEGWRGELAWSATSYSDRYGYIFKTKVVPKNDAERAKMNVLFADNTSKCYFQPVEVGIRGIPRDEFNRGDFLEAEVYRELIL